VATTFAQEVVALRREMAQAETQRAINALNHAIDAAVKAESAPGSGATASRIESLRRRVAELVLLKTAQSGDVQLAEAAPVPRQPNSPNPLRNAILAGMVALILGLVVVVLLSSFDTRIRDERELVALIGAPVLARIPEVPRLKRLGHAGTRRQDDSFREAVQFLRLSVQRLRPQGESVVVAVTSPMAGDGKTMVVAWLAQSLAFTGSEVAAVDCDLRNPTLHTYFDAGQEIGGVLPNLRMVRAGDHPALASGLALPSGLVGQERLREMLDQLRRTADYVLLDTSPISSVAHASAVAAAADEVILVVDLKRIRRKDLRAAKEQLDNARARILGVALNRAAADLTAYYAPEEHRAPEHPSSVVP
jgi:Mrp family chromosome partitioning ATPase